MNHLLFRLKAYLLYQWKAVGPHSLHSPFLFQLYSKVIKPSKSFKIEKVERLRKELFQNSELIEVIDFKSGKSRLRVVANVARTSISSRKFSAFMHLLVKHLNVSAVLETGTSFGINTLYLATSQAKKVITIEGSRIISRLAEKSFSQTGQENIRLVNGNLYDCLEQEIVRNQPELYFLDADHRSTALAFCIDLILKHTPNTQCIVIHDIYWSPDMKEMWNELIEDPRFSLTIDLFQAGLLFPSLEMPKQHFTLRF